MVQLTMKFTTLSVVQLLAPAAVGIRTGLRNPSQIFRAVVRGVAIFMHHGFTILISPERSRDKRSYVMVPVRLAIDTQSIFPNLLTMLPEHRPITPVNVAVATGQQSWVFWDLNVLHVMVLMRVVRHFHPP